MPPKNKGSIAPFEIMRRAEEQAKIEQRFAEAKGEDSAVGVAEAEPETQQAAKEPHPSGRARKAWWAAFDEPVILKVPRGIAIAICLGILALIAMAYWVGESRGYKEAQRVAIEEAENLSKRFQYLGIGRGAPEQLGAPLTEREAVEELTLTDRVMNATNDIVVPPSMDPREIGKNYLQITTCSKEKAIELIDFLRTYQVESAAFTAHNSKTVTVVALRGFDVTQQPGSDGYNFRSDMLRVGQDWQRRNGRNTRDLSDMFFSRYDESDRQAHIKNYQKYYGQ